MYSRFIYLHISAAAALLLLLLSISGCSGSDDRESGAETGIKDLQVQGRKMPSFTLPRPLAEDNPVSSESLQGKVVLVTFFASWCRSCLEEIPLLKKLQKKFGEENFVIIAMAVDRENELGLKNLIQKQKINYPVLLADEALKKDFGGIAVLPTMFLVNRDGLLLKKYSGHIERDSLVRDISRAVEQ